MKSSKETRFVIVPDNLFPIGNGVPKEVPKDFTSKVDGNNKTKVRIAGRDPFFDWLGRRYNHKEQPRDERK